MRALAYALLLGLVGAGIVHIAILLMAPSMSERDAWSRLSAAAPPFAMVRVSADPGVEPIIAGIDPLFEAAACRFDVSDAPAHVVAPGRPPFWSVSIYDRAGRNLYSFNDRNAVDRTLDLLIVSEAQMIELRKAPPDDYAASVIVETAATEGIVVVRSFVPDAAWREAALSQLAAATCAPG